MARATTTSEAVTTVPAAVDVDERARLTQGVAGLLTQAERLATAGLVTKEDAAEAGLLVRAARARLRVIKKHYVPITDAVRRSLADIKRLAAEDSAPCLRIDALLAEPMKAWIIADREAAETANRAALVDAETKAREERTRQAEALRGASAAAPTQREKLSLLSQARQVERSTPLPMVTTLVEPTRIAGIATPTRRVGEVIDFKLLLRAVVAGRVPEAVLKVDQAWLDEQATSRGRDLNFPGVIVREKATLSARGF